MTPQKVSADVLSWASDMDEGTIKQAEKTASLPFVVKPLALMADAHVGFGSTVGSVVATDGAIIPSCIGVDIGCGMIATRFGLTAAQLPDDLTTLLFNIETRIPSGVGQGHAFATDWDRERHTRKVPSYSGASSLTGKQINTITDQFGTLGSGNHFVEVCLDEADFVWIVLHSGSRGIGNQLATKAIDGAKGDMKRMFISLPDPDLAYLVEGSPEFESYIRDMLWSQEYAMESREQMMRGATSALVDVLGYLPDIISNVNCHHNFTTKENHHNRNMWITRKGAVRARTGDLGIIPGSMGTATFIVEGLGNPASYMSSSHGAGRRLSRGVARRTLSVDAFKDQMKGQMWQESDADALLDEAPDSYKDIHQVMEDQKDLVRIKHTLTSILNYKGVK